MTTGPADLLERIDAIAAALAELRAAVAGARNESDFGHGVIKAEADVVADLADGNLLDTTSAAARFGHPRDTIAKWCRQGDGVKQGGRWLANVALIRQRLNGRG